MEEKALAAGGSAEAEPVGRARGPRTNCVAHCVTCGAHFASDTAFFAHRRGEPDSRYCDTEATNRDGEHLLVVKSERGSCSLQDPPIVGSATVYAVRDWWKAASTFGTAA